jgi:dUTP pyrophosphatase
MSGTMSGTMYGLDTLFVWTSNAPAPTRAHTTDACYDVYANECVTIPCHTTITESADPDAPVRTVDTGLTLSMPPRYMMQIKPRSGLTLRGITVGAGVIDAGYRGPVKVALINLSNRDYTVNVGDKIAQMQLMHVPELPMIVSVEPYNSVEDMYSTERGTGGFGSTGM